MMDGRDLHIPNERPGKSGFGLGLKNTYKGLKPSSVPSFATDATKD